MRPVLSFTSLRGSGLALGRIAGGRGRRCSGGRGLGALTSSGSRWRLNLGVGCLTAPTGLPGSPGFPSLLGLALPVAVVQVLGYLLESVKVIGLALLGDAVLEPRRKSVVELVA